MRRCAMEKNLLFYHKLLQREASVKKGAKHCMCFWKTCPLDEITLFCATCELVRLLEKSTDELPVQQPTRAKREGSLGLGGERRRGGLLPSPNPNWFEVRSLSKLETCLGLVFERTKKKQQNEQNKRMKIWGK